jgi:starvation-inducible DNA-binding protein
MAINQQAVAMWFRAHIDIPAELRDQLVAILNQHLADTLDLSTQAKQADRNVKSKDFYQLHLLFDEIAAELAGFVDLLAERATSLGG